MVADFMKASDLRAISLRYFNACGAGETGLVGELRNPETHLIRRAIMKLQGYLPEFAIFGTDYNTPDGTAVRDYIHVADLAQAHLLALDALYAGKRNGTYNLGTGKGHTVNEIIFALENATKRRIGAVIKDRRRGDPAMLVADASAARRDLAFSPTHSDLGTIIASAWSWHQFAHPLQSQLTRTAI
jgi:UDP-arabinose 4-epimerase